MSGFGIPSGSGGGSGGGDASAANQLTQINLSASTNSLLGAGLPSSLGAGGGIKIDSSGSAIPVSGTITTNIGTTNGLALDTTLTILSNKFATLGQKTSNGSTPVVIASDQSTIPISAISLPLPIGASTAALQTSGNSILSNLDNKSPILINGRIPIDGSGVTQPISGSISITGALPTGNNVIGHVITDTGSTIAISNFPATQPISGTITANIGTTNGLALDSTLTSLNNKFNSLGQKTSINSTPVVIASDQSTLNISGSVSISNFPATQPISGTVTANIGTTNGLALESTLTTLSNKFNSLGQKTSTGSTPVVIASDQSSLSVTVGNFPTTQAISAVSLPLPTGASTSSLQTTTNNSLSSIDGKIITVNTGAVVVSSSALPIGASTAALQTSGNASLSSIDSKSAVLISGRVPVDGSGVIQPISGSITANIGTTNGLALDSNLTSLRAQIPSTLGQKTSSNSLAVVIASDQSSISITGSVNAAAPVWSRNATGSITSASTGTIKNASGRLRAVRILYTGAGTNYFQLHDKVTATAFSSATLVGFGYELSNSLDSMLLDFSEELVMPVGICWAISSTQATYTAVAQNAIVFAEFI